MKFGVWLLVAAIAFLWFNHAKKARLKQRRRDADTARGAERADAAATRAVEHIVACAHCGLHVPASDAVLGMAGRPFCSEAHRRLQPPA